MSHLFQIPLTNHFTINMKEHSNLQNSKQSLEATLQCLLTTSWLQFEQYQWKLTMDVCRTWNISYYCDPFDEKHFINNIWEVQIQKDLNEQKLILTSTTAVIIVFLYCFLVICVLVPYSLVLAYILNLVTII